MTGREMTPHDGPGRRWLAPKPDQEHLEFQPDIVEIEERATPRAAEFTLWAVAALIVTTVTWASLARIDRVVTASGHLITASNRIVVQPLETGVIRTLSVRTGQAVKKGEVLATLDATFTQADTASSQKSLTSLDAQIARLEAELSDANVSRFSGDEAENALQTRLFEQRKADLTANLSSLDAEIAGATAELAANRREADDARKSVEVFRKVEEMRQTLVAHAAGSQLQLLEAQEKRYTAERDLNRLTNRNREIEEKLSSARQKREAFLGESHTKTAQELQTTRRDRDKVAEDLKKQERRSSLVELTAPEDAVVLEIAQKSVGSVASQAEPLITLVPADAVLEAEVDVAPADIGLLKTGDLARIKLEALPYQQHGALQGRLDVIGADTVKSEQDSMGRRNTVFRARLVVTDAHLRGVPADFRLIPGMTLTAEIKIGTRRVISYFVYPLFRALDESFREP